MRNRADERDTPNSSTNLKLVKKRASDEIILTLELTSQYRFSSRIREVVTHIVDIVDMIAENWAISTEVQPGRMKEDE